MPDWGMPIVVLVFGVVLVIAEIWRMEKGWGTASTRVVGLTIVMTLAVFLVLVSNAMPNVAAEKFMAAYGILGAIAGYLFGKE